MESEYHKAYGNFYVGGESIGWSIDLNWRENVKITTIAHEFGHVFGLNDLYDSNNTDKLMYCYDSRTATKPTPIDIKGFNAITGRHSTHLFKFYSSSPLHGKPG